MRDRLLMTLFLSIAFLGCKTSPQTDSSQKTKNNEVSKKETSDFTKTLAKNDTLYIYDEKLSWEPFENEKKDLGEIISNYQEIKREIDYNDNSDFNDTLVTYKLNNNEVIVYSTEQDKSIREANIQTNGSLNFNNGLKIGLTTENLLKKYKLKLNQKFSTIIICPDDDEMQELVLKTTADSIVKIFYSAYYD